MFRIDWERERVCSVRGLQTIQHAKRNVLPYVNLLSVNSMSVHKESPTVGLHAQIARRWNLALLARPYVPPTHYVEVRCARHHRVIGSVNILHNVTGRRLSWYASRRDVLFNLYFIIHNTD